MGSDLVAFEYCSLADMRDRLFRHIDVPETFTVDPAILASCSAKLRDRRVISVSIAIYETTLVVLRHSVFRSGRGSRRHESYNAELLYSGSNLQKAVGTYGAALDPYAGEIVTPGMFRNAGTVDVLGRRHIFETSTQRSLAAIQSNLRAYNDRRQGTINVGRDLGFV